MEPLLRTKFQRGYLLIIATILIVIIGFAGITLVQMFLGGSSSEVNVLQSNQALYTAFSGMEIAKRDIVANNVACDAINGTAKYTAANLVHGQFTATGYANSISSTITSAINNTDSSPIIILANTSGFNPNGGVLKINNELFYYSSINGTILQSVKRALGGTTVAAHSVGTKAYQNQCELTAIGAVPSFAKANAKRTVREVLPIVDSGFSIDGMYPVIVSLNNVTMSGTTSIVNPSVWGVPPNPNPSPDYTGSTIITVGNVDMNGSVNTEVCGCGTPECLLACQNGTGLIPSSTASGKQPDVITNYSGISSTDLFSKFFSISKAQMLSYVQTPQPTTQYFANLSGIAPLNGIVGKTIWVSGSIKDSGNISVSVGTPAQPVILIIDGDFTLTGSTRLAVYGLLYVTGDFKGAGTGSLLGNGIVASEKAMALSGNALIVSDTSVVSKLGDINPFMEVTYVGNAANRQEIFQ